MTRLSSVLTNSEREAILAQFNHNLPRYLSGVAGSLSQQLVSACAAAGYDGIKATQIQLLFKLVPEGGRVVDIAQYWDITQQAAGQIVNVMGQQGYLKRKPDTIDKRAKKLLLTAKGQKLITCAASASQRIDRELARVIGDAELTEFKGSCALLFYGLGIATEGERPVGQNPAYSLPLYLAGLVTHSERQLMELDKAKGHTQLKMSFAQVLMYTSPHGTLINDLARINNISKQAISQTVKQVEKLGYVQRRQHPGDARSSMIFLTNAGLRLIEDSIDNISVLKAGFVRILGKNREKRFAQTAECLFKHVVVSAAPLAGEISHLSAAAILQRTLEQLYLESGDTARSKLFNRAGHKVKLSASALKVLGALEIRMSQ